MNSKYRIETVDSNNKYEGLRTLWCEVFGDEPSFVDSMYANFGEDIAGYVAVDADGRVCSALTCFCCGTFEGKPVYTSYAICTAPELRGLGLAGSLVEAARDDVLSKGSISLISPAEPSLEKFYGAHGYLPFFFVDKRNTEDGSDEDAEDFIFDEEDDEYAKAEPKMELAPLDYIGYNKYREEFLADIPHVRLNEHMLRLVQAESTLPTGESGLLLVNGGDAICAVNYTDANEEDAAEACGEMRSAMPEIEELLINPRLSSISSEIADEMACRLAAHFGQPGLRYRVPGASHCQSMAAGLTEEMKEEASAGLPAYYGFPVE